VWGHLRGACCCAGALAWRGGTLTHNISHHFFQCSHALGGLRHHHGARGQHPRNFARRRVDEPVVGTFAVSAPRALLRGLGWRQALQQGVSGRLVIGPRNRSHWQRNFRNGGLSLPLPRKEHSCPGEPRKKQHAANRDASGCARIELGGGCA
jgi:hypothetical protein